jgi:hypothetical protein
MTSPAASTAPVSPSGDIDYDRLGQSVADASGANAGNYTTPRARNEAGSFLNDFKDRMDSNNPEQQKLYEMYGKNADNAKQILQAARDRIAGMQRPESTLQQLAYQQGIDQPVQGHDYGAMFGHVREKLLQNQLAGNQFNVDKANQLTQIDQEMNQTDSAQLAARLQMLKEKLTQSGNIAGKAMTVFGKIDAPNKYNTAPTTSPDADLEKQHQLQIVNGYKAGVPVPAYDPFQNFTDPKQRAAAVLQEQEKANASLDKNFGATQDALHNKLGTLDEMDRLAATGKIRFGGTMANIDSTLHNLLPSNAYNDSEQAYIKDANALARMGRMPGERYSQWDGKMLQTLVPSIANSPDAAGFLRQSLRAAARQQLDYINFKRAYVQVYGTDTGEADQKWDEYLNSPAGRIFNVPQGNETDIKKIGLNGSRVPWQTFFRQQMAHHYPGIDKAVKLPDDDGTGFAEGGSVEAPSGSQERSNPAGSSSKVLNIFNKYKTGLTDSASPLSDVDDFSQRVMGLRTRYARGGRVGFAAGGDSGTPDYSNDTTSGAAREAVNGMTLGWGPKAIAKVESLLEDPHNVTGVQGATSDDAYKALLQEELRRNGQYEKAQPVAAHLANFGGSLLLPGSKLVGTALSKGPLLMRGLKSIIAGGGMGAIASMGSNTDDSPGATTDAAISGAKSGALLGPLASAVGSLGAKYGVKGLRALGSTLGGAFDRMAGTPGLVGDAVRNPTKGETLLSGALQRDTGSGSGAPGATSLLDAGQNTQSLARSAARASPEAAEALGDTLDTRDAGRRAGADSLLNNTFAPSEPFGEESKILDRLKKESAANWQAAYQNGTNIPHGPAIARIQSSPTGQIAMSDANRVLADRGVTPPNTGTNGTPLTTEYLDEVRQQLENQYQKAGTPGGQAAISNLKSGLTQHLKDNNPDFTKALDTHADDQRVLGALRLGRDQFHNMSPDELNLHVNGDGTTKYPGLNFSERDALTSGAIGTLQSKLASKAGSPNVAGGLLSTPGMMDKFKVLLQNDPNKLARFSEGLEQMARQHETDSRVRAGLGLGPPPTDENAANLSTAGHLALGASGHPFGFLSGVTGLYRRMAQMSPKTAGDISAMVSETDPVKVAGYQQNLLRQGVKAQDLQNAMARGRMAALNQSAQGSGYNNPEK